jgi:hypothetical protein
MNKPSGRMVAFAGASLVAAGTYAYLKANSEGTIAFLFSFPRNCMNTARSISFLFIYFFLPAC